MVIVVDHEKRDVDDDVGDAKSTSSMRTKQGESKKPEIEGMNREKVRARTSTRTRVDRD